MHVLSILAEAGPSKTPFFIVGGGLAAWAVILAALGLSRPDFPGSATAARGVMVISALLVAGAMVAAVATS
jgi:hypothetical protein